MLTEDIYLDSYLAPFAPFLARADVTDIYVNRPGELWLETVGGRIEQVDLPGLTGTVLGRLARQVAASNAQGINREHPLLAAKLPDGSRIQIALPPATRGDIAIAIRKHVAIGLTLDDLAQQGAFSSARLTGPDASPPAREGVRRSGKVEEILRNAVRSRRNILVSGGTSSGKTTFLNALLQEVPLHERLILIEDTPELQLHHQNAVGLVAARGALGEAEITPEDLLIASLRMRPDRIILGEMRGREAMTFLRAINTGHPGSLSTIHADSPDRAIDQIALLVLQTGPRMAWEEIAQYVRRSVDLIVQLRRDGEQRQVESVLDLRAA